MLARNSLRLYDGLLGEGALADANRSVEPLSWFEATLRRHKTEGRPVVLVSSTPRRLVEPFAEEHGFDDVIATDVSDGELVGHYIWGKGKLAAVHHWMIDNDLRLADSAAYADSIFDLALLDAVGDPVAVNPDAGLADAAARREWPVIVDQAPGIPPASTDLQRLVAPWIRNEFNPFCVVDTDSIDVPGDGPVVLDLVVDSPRELVEAVSVVADLTCAADRGAFFALPRWVMATPMIGGIAALVGAVVAEPDTLSRLMEGGHIVARIDSSPAEEREEIGGVESIGIALDRCPPVGEALRPKVNARPVSQSGLQRRQ